MGGRIPRHGDIVRELAVSFRQKGRLTPCIDHLECVPAHDIAARKQLRAQPHPKRIVHACHHLSLKVHIRFYRISKRKSIETFTVSRSFHKPRYISEILCRGTHCAPARSPKIPLARGAISEYDIDCGLSASQSNKPFSLRSAKINRSTGDTAAISAVVSQTISAISEAACNSPVCSAV